MVMFRRRRDSGARGFSHALEARQRLRIFGDKYIKQFLKALGSASHCLPTYGGGAGLPPCLFRLMDDLDLQSGRTIFTMPNRANNGADAGPNQHSSLQPAPSVRQRDPLAYAGTPEEDQSDC